MDNKPEITNGTVIVDSREKWTQSGSTDKHIRAYLERHKVPYIVRKLAVGDYMIFGGSVSVDRKHSVEEISRNLTNPTDKKRFLNEVRLAHRLGVRLVVLIESNTYHDVYSLREWHSKYSPVRGTVLIRQMERLCYAYGVQFIFCHKKSVAKRILEILGIEVAGK